MNRDKKESTAAEDTPDGVPLFGTWRKAYLAVVIFFVIDVVVFYAFSRYFS